MTDNLDIAEKRINIAEKRMNIKRARILMRMIEDPIYSLDDDRKKILIYEIVQLLTGRELPELLDTMA